MDIPSWPKGDPETFQMVVAVRGPDCDEFDTFIQLSSAAVPVELRTLKKGADGADDVLRRFATTMMRALTKWEEPTPRWEQMTAAPGERR